MNPFSIAAVIHGLAAFVRPYSGLHLDGLHAQFVTPWESDGLCELFNQIRKFISRMPIIPFLDRGQRIFQKRVARRGPPLVGKVAKWPISASRSEAMTFVTCRFASMGWISVC